MPLYLTKKNIYSTYDLSQVSASDPDCGVNAMVNYTLGDGSPATMFADFEVRHDTGEVCIVGELDYERRSAYELPVIATDRGKCLGRN